jgi:hypothetical protein
MATTNGREVPIHQYSTAVEFIAKKRYTASIFSDIIIAKCPSRITVHKTGPTE